MNNFGRGDRIYLKPEHRMPNDDTPSADTIHEIIAIDDKHYRFEGSFIFIEDQDKFELVEQKPAWSEEDEVMFRKAIITIDNVRMDTGFSEYYLGISKWLTSLKNRILPKPAEWSEENEKTIHLACEFIRHHSNHNDSIGGIDCSILIERLKSLRPHTTWKPSVFHLECISDAIAIYEERGINAIGLKEILEELKKLRER